METITTIINRIADQAAPKAPTTQTSRVLSDLLSKELDGFLTLNDPVLDKMLTAAKDFMFDMQHKQTPRWLSYCGISGTGKTFLAKKIKKAARLLPDIRDHKVLICPIIFAFWPDLLSELREGEFWKMDDLSQANLVIMDEIAIDHDPSGFAADKLCQILSRRVGKWTVLTSNWTLSKIQQIDPRISSRMLRDNSVVIGCDTLDYATR